jgi:hypothetical protein
MDAIRSGSFGLQFLVADENGSIRDHEGNTFNALPIYSAERDGQTRYFVPAPRVGQKYALRAILPYGQYECAFTVDGLDALTGKDASAGQEGIILQNGADIMTGFLLDGGQSVAAFTIAKVDQSYVVQSGGSEKQVGKVALRVYAKKYTPPPIFRGPRRGGCFPLSAAPASASVGTGFGEEQDFKTSKIDWKRGNLEADFVLHYAPASALKKAKIIPAQKPTLPCEDADTYPADKVKGAKPPKGWTGSKKKPNKRRGRKS